MKKSAKKKKATKPSVSRKVARKTSKPVSSSKQAKKTKKPLLSKKQPVKKASKATGKAKPVKKVSKTAGKAKISKAPQKVKKRRLVFMRSTKAPEGSKPSTKRKASHKLSDKALSEVRQILLRTRRLLENQVQTLRGESLKRDDEVNIEEDGSDAFERQFALNVASSQSDRIFEIDEALERIEEKTYGICEQCEEPIELPRLKALPFVKLCIKCKAENEKGVLKYKPLPSNVE